MRRNLLPAAALTAAALLLPATAAVANPAAPVNLVLNSGFERGDSGHWSCEDHTVGWPGLAGQAALHGVTSDNSTGRCAQTIAVRPGSRLRLQAWAKGRQVRLGVTGKGSATSAAYLPDWSVLTHDFQVGPAEDTVEVYVSGWYAQGRFAVDDVAVLAAPTRAPEVPTGVTFHGGSGGSGGSAGSGGSGRTAVLSWAPAARATGYRVFSAEGSLMHDTLGPATRAAVWVGEGQRSELIVVAYNASGVSGPAAPATVTTPVDADAVPYAPRAVGVSPGPGESLWTAWEAVQTATGGYAVYVDGRLWGRSTGPALRVDGLARSRTYRIEVSAFNERGESPRSRVSYGTTLPAGAVPPPV
jgi:hypothetical protein